MEKISSVLENPFYKNYGLKQNVPPPQREDHSRHVTHNGTDANNDSDDIGEYRPGSGFVYKLLGKFSSRNAKEETAQTTSYLKRSTSLEEVALTTENTNGKSRAVTFKDPVFPDSSTEKRSFSNLLSQSHRAKSIESLNHTHRKAHHHNLAVSLRHIETKWVKEKQAAPPKSPRESHVHAPDVDLARDDIIIIETTPSIPLPLRKDDSEDESSSDDNSPKLLSYREELPHELPKPNTVSNVRSIFETASSSSGSNVTTGSSSKKSKPEPFSHSPRRSSGLQTDSTQISSPTSKVESEVSTTITTTPLSPTQRFSSNDTHSKPVFVSPPRKLEVSSHVHEPPLLPTSLRSGDRKDSHSHTKGSFSPSNAPSSPRDTNGPSADVSGSTSFSASIQPTSPVFESGNSFDTTRMSNAVRPIPSPRSTASVKPTVSKKPIPPVRPIPLSAPASAATSYKKSSPVVPVAPFKDKQEDPKDDGKPIMIFEKSKLSPTKKRLPRTKVYTPIDETNKKNDAVENNCKTDMIIQRDMRKGVEKSVIDETAKETNNRILSLRKNSTDSSDTTADNKVTSDQTKIYHNSRQTTIEIQKSPTAVPILQKPKSFSIQKNKPEGVVKSKEAEIRLAKPETVDSKSVIIKKTGDSVKRHRAPEPDKEKKSQGMIYISSSESSESETSPPETPRTQPQQTNSQEPVKGIPSIIANRLKKQNTHPSQAANSVVSNVNDSSNNPTPFNIRSCIDNDYPSPRIGLNPVSTTNDKEQDKDSISNTIQNEIDAVRKKMEVNRPKSTGVAQIFDSSQLAQKRKENQRLRAAANAAAQGIVPPLDLSSITDDRSRERRIQPKEIKPCNIVFLGENVKTSRSLLKKQRKVKVNIHFNDTVTQTFEYPSQEHALDLYLEEHPHEAKDILFLEEFGADSNSGDSFGESSDDTDTVDVMEIPVTPRGNSDKDLLKSDLSLSSTGSLQSYRGRFQEEFVFGSSLAEPEPPSKIAKPEPTADPENMMLRPAEEDDTSTWSTNDSSDLLF